MAVINVSEHLKSELDEDRDAKGHKSLDSLIREYKLKAQMYDRMMEDDD